MVLSGEWVNSFFFILQKDQLAIIGHIVLCEYKMVTRMRNDTRKKNRGLKPSHKLNPEKFYASKKKPENGVTEEETESDVPAGEDGEDSSSQ